MPLQLRQITAENQFMNILVYGDPGSGKTTLTATAREHPAMSPVLILNFEGGLLSIANLPGVIAADIRTSADLDEALFGLLQRKNGYEQFKTVVIDSGSEMAAMILREWVSRNMQRAEKKGRGNQDRTIDDVQIEDYGKMTAQVRRVFSQFRDLPIHVVITAHAKNVYPPNADQRVTSPMEVRPNFTDNLGTAVMGMVDNVWFMYTGLDEGGVEHRYILTRRQGIYHAKTRGFNFAKALGPVVQDPHLAAMYELLLRTENPASMAASAAQEREENE